jgi:hypothetical protein
LKEKKAGGGGGTIFITGWKNRKFTLQSVDTVV